MCRIKPPLVVLCKEEFSLSKCSAVIGLGKQYFLIYFLKKHILSLLALLPNFAWAIFKNDVAWDLYRAQACGARDFGFPFFRQRGGKHGA